MNFREARVALRERGIWDVFDVALRFFVTNARAYLWPSLACVVPPAIISCFVGYAAGPEWAWTTAIALSLFAATPVTLMTSRLVFEERPSTSEILVKSIGKSLGLIPLRILQIVAVGVGTMFFVLPGAWLTVLFFITPEIAIAEDSGPMATAARAQRVVGAAFGEMASMGLVVLVLRVSWVFVADIAGRALLEDLLQITPPAPIWQTGGGIISYTAFFLILPLEAVARFFFYLNVRTKTEGWDIQARFLAIARRHETEEAVR
jgi:hypothetical protein